MIERIRTRRLENGLGEINQDHSKLTVPVSCVIAQLTASLT